MRSQDRGAQGFADGLFGHQLVSVPRAYSASGRPLSFAFGGVDNFEAASNALYSVELLESSVAVSSVSARGAPPSPRYRHAMCLVEQSSLG